MANSTAWTPERRARQAELIRIYHPWTKSTGPRTPEGKAVSSQNAARPNSLKRQLHDFLADVRLDLQRDRLR